MEENESNIFKSVKTPKNKSSFSKNVLLPFISGIVGTSLVIGVCFGIPEVRTKIIGEQGYKSSDTSYEAKPSSTTTVNATAVSLKEYSDTAIGVAEKVQPSIVGIEIEYNVNSFFGRSTAKGSGSGIIISEDGYILTNNHVVSTSDTNTSSAYYQVSDAVSVKVKLYNDETLYDAKIIGKDDETDLAVIKIEKNGLTKAELGDSDSVKVRRILNGNRKPTWIIFKCNRRFSKCCK